MSDVRYPRIKVALSERDGTINSFIFFVKEELQKHGLSQQDLNEFTSDALSDSPRHALTVIRSWVTVI